MEAVAPEQVIIMEVPGGEQAGQDYKACSPQGSTRDSFCPWLLFTLRLNSCLEYLIIRQNINSDVPYP